MAGDEKALRYGVDGGLSILALALGISTGNKDLTNAGFKRVESIANDATGLNTPAAPPATPTQAATPAPAPAAAPQGKAMQPAPGPVPVPWADYDPRTLLPRNT